MLPEETADEFIKAQNQMVYNACLTLLTNICEGLDKLSAETKSKLTKLDLRAIKGMRNRIVHDYQNLDSYIIFDAIQKDLPPLKETLYEVISAGLKKTSSTGKISTFPKSANSIRILIFQRLNADFKKNSSCGLINGAVQLRMVGSTGFIQL